MYYLDIRSRNEDYESKIYNYYHGYIAVAVCCFGILTNVINVIIWSRQQVRSSVNITLRVLCATDLLVLTSYLVFVVYTFFITGPHSTYHHGQIGMYVILVSFHIFLASLSWSNWTVITLAILRLLKGTVTNLQVKKRFQIAFISVVIVICVLPVLSFLYYRVAPCDEINLNFTLMKNCTGYWLTKTDIVVNNTFYHKTFFWLFGIFNGLLPGFLFLFLCICMFVMLVRLAHSNVSSEGFYRKTLGLFVILLMFTGISVAETLYCFDLVGLDRKHTQFFFFMDDFPFANLMDLMQLINCSVDILIYIPMSKGYRRELGNAFLCLCHHIGFTRLQDEEESSIDEDEIKNAQAVVQVDVLFE